MGNQSLSDHDLLIRIDERVINMDEKMDTFVTREEIRPLWRFYYGAIWIVGGGLLITLVRKAVVAWNL